MKRLRIAFAPLLLLLAAAVALAAVPAAERIENAIAETNKAGGRSEALRLEVSLKIGEEGRVVARGELISHPQGLARLELHGAGNLVERHLLQGRELMVSRDGEILDDHRIFLAPFFILQADTPDLLRMALETYEVQADMVGLAMCGEYDCFVIGDPRRQVLPAAPPALRGIEQPEGNGEPDNEFESGLEGPTLDEDGSPPADADRIWAKLWVDMETYEIRGLDSATGVHVRFGPIASFDDLRVPAWVTIEEPGKGTSRFEVHSASQVTAPASAFTPDWLTSPAISRDQASPEDSSAPPE
ncbi:MAG: hypothetical protein JRH19_24310 [Deltaproteobacteria bacterium]|nr:hypothetical protein [Deltaproteobacteria bacterium]